MTRDEKTPPEEDGGPRIHERHLQWEVVCPECLPTTYLSRSRYEPSSMVVRDSHNNRLGHHAVVQEVRHE